MSVLITWRNCPCLCDIQIQLLPTTGGDKLDSSLPPLISIHCHSIQAIRLPVVALCLPLMIFYVGLITEHWSVMLSFPSMVWQIEGMAKIAELWLARLASVLSFLVAAVFSNKLDRTHLCTGGYSLTCRELAHSICPSGWSDICTDKKTMRNWFAVASETEVTKTACIVLGRPGNGALSISPIFIWWLAIDAPLTSEQLIYNHFLCYCLF